MIDYALSNQRKKSTSPKYYNIISMLQEDGSVDMVNHDVGEHKQERVVAGKCLELNFLLVYNQDVVNL